MDSPLDELHLDALGELLNIGMGAAAASLSTMVKQEVTLTVPIINVISVKDIANNLDDMPPNSVCAVKQHFEGNFSGDAFLLFSESKSLSLVQAVLGEKLPFEQLGELEEEAITEIGNIILNACIGSLANIFNNQLESDVPLFLQDTLHNIFAEDIEENTIKHALLLRMAFNINKQGITGYVTFVMDLKSISEIKDQIDNMLGI